MKTKKEIQGELALRELSRRKLSFFTKYTMPEYEMIAEQNNEKIHEKIMEKLEAVESGQIKRLMIFMPPRMGKSELVSKRFPAWCLGKDPKRKIVVSSYGADLSNEFGRKTKQIVESSDFKNIFEDFKLSKDKREGGNWETSKGGGMYTAGVGGALTGKGFDIGIIDDPVKDRQESESSTIQERNIEWYTSTFYTRQQNQNSAIIVMMTRWNINDLAGYLQDEQKNGGDKWDLLVIQGIDDETGEEIIWEGKWDKGYMKSVKKNILGKDWSALYQQDPINATKSIFNLSNLRYFNLSDFEREDGILKKDDLEVGLFVDPAFSSSAKSDDAVCLAIGRHKLTKNYYLLEGYADTSAPSLTFKAILSQWDKLIVEGFKPKYISIENVYINREQTKFIKDFKMFLLENSRNITINLYEPKIKKEDRIKFGLEPLISLNGLYLRKDLQDSTLIKRIERQLQDFPNSKKDDIIDTIEQGRQGLEVKLKTKTKRKIYVPKSTWN